MITNKRQYNITRKLASRFSQALDEFDAKSADRTNVHPRIVLAERDALRGQLEDLEIELREYERLKSTNVSDIKIASIYELPEGLIKARIASGLSQRELAERLEIKAQQIQRYEAEGYASASFQRLCEVARAVGLWTTPKPSSG